MLVTCGIALLRLCLEQISSGTNTLTWKKCLRMLQVLDKYSSVGWNGNLKNKLGRLTSTLSYDLRNSIEPEIFTSVSSWFIPKLKIGSSTRDLRKLMVTSTALVAFTKEQLSSLERNTWT